MSGVWVGAEPAGALTRNLPGCMRSESRRCPSIAVPSMPSSPYRNCTTLPFALRTVPSYLRAHAGRPYVVKPCRNPRTQPTHARLVQRHCCMSRRSQHCTTECCLQMLTSCGVNRCKTAHRHAKLVMPLHARRAVPAVPAHDGTLACPATRSEAGRSAAQCRCASPPLQAQRVRRRQRAAAAHT